MPEPKNLVALVGSRICHDLISPIGAINNGLELLTLSGADSGPEMSLINQSVGNASARIRFFRIAFGAAGDQMIGQTEVSAILRDLYAEGRLTLNWSPTAPQSRAAIRLVFLAILCFETAMPYGGTLDIEEKNTKWILTGRADRLIIEDTLWNMLSGGGTPDNLLPSHVQFALMPLIAAAENRSLRVVAEASHLTLGF